MSLLVKKGKIMLISILKIVNVN